MHILFIAKDLVLPSHDGGRLASRNDMAALAAAGANVTLLVMHRAALTAEAATSHRAEYQRVIFARQRSSKLRTAVTHPRLPYMSSSRVPTSGDYSRVVDEMVQLPPIDLIVASAEYTLPIGLELGRRFGARVILRSENNEVAYTFRMIPFSSSAKRKAFLMSEGYRLSWALGSLLTNVACVAVISADDASVYLRHGANTAVIPPTLSQHVRPLSGVPSFSERGVRIAFVGSLDAPHTVRRPFVVCPRGFTSHSSRGRAGQLDVIGRGLGEGLRHALTRIPGVRVVGEVPDLEPYLDRSRVFVNPIFQGSGVNMKVGPPAAAGLPIVSTSFGVRGLVDLRGSIETADSPEQFAHQCLRLLHESSYWMEHASKLVATVRDRYSAGAVAAAWKGLLEGIGPRNGGD